MSDSVVGKIFQEMDECVVVWKIPNFTTKLSDPPSTYYNSPAFAFSDRCWYLNISPSGDSRKGCKDMTSLFLNLKGKHECTITFTMNIRNAEGDAEFSHNMEHTFLDLNDSWGVSMCAKTKLMDRKSQLLPDDTLTVECRLKRKNSSPLGVSLMNRLLNLQKDLKKILKNKESCDLVLKLDGREIKAHRVILENRCKVFESMLSHDMVERRTGEITIDDIDPDVFQGVLAYMYSGEVEKLSTENVCEIYVAADKYQLDELKRQCAAFIGNSLSDDLFCDVMAIPDSCIDVELMLLLKEFFCKNLMSVTVTEKWKHLYEGKKDVLFELVLSTLRANSEVIKKF